MGRNVDGLFHEYQLGFMPLQYYHEYDSFYTDEIGLDLGIVTNTGKLYCINNKLSNFISVSNKTITYLFVKLMVGKQAIMSPT